MHSTPQKGKPTGAGATAGSKTKHTHALIVGQVADGLALTTTTTEARIDSRLLARQLGNKSKAVVALLDRYLNVFKQHGQLTFKKEVGERKQGGGNAERYALLNENQAYLLLNLSRNSDTVVALKSKLITAFSNARRAADLRRTEYLPGYHVMHDQIKVLAAGSSSERFDHMNFNKLVNKVAGVEAGQRAGAPVPKQGLMIASQILMTAAMQPAKSSREAYRLAAQAVQPLANAVLALEAKP